MKKIIPIVAFILLIPVVQSADCFPEYSCGEWSQCDDDLQTRTCQDIKCNTGENIERRFCGGSQCRPEIECTEWTPCTNTEKTTDILQGKINFQGYQQRFCKDLKECSDDFTEERACEESYKLKLEKIEECGENKIIATDPLSLRPIAKISLDSWKKQKLEISFTQGQQIYCPSCYNGIKDSNEERIDCGADCKPCKEKHIKIFTILAVSFWAISAVFFFLFIKGLIHNIKTIPKNHKNFNIRNRKTKKLK